MTLRPPVAIPGLLLIGAAVFFVMNPRRKADADNELEDVTPGT
jgi:hypothetical protein